MHHKHLTKLALLALMSLLVSCASLPEFDTTAVDDSLTPQSVIADPKNSRGKVALWGGTILETRNLKDITQIEILAYPLNSSHIPLIEKKPLGRFIIKHKGFLEPSTYATGKRLTVLGNIGNMQQGVVGEARYTYSVIQARQLHLWSKDAGQSNTRFHFGIGVQL